MGFATYLFITVVLGAVGLLSGVMCGEQDEHVNKYGPTDWLTENGTDLWELWMKGNADW